MQIVGHIKTYASIITQVIGEPTLGPNSKETDKTSIEWHFTLNGLDIELTDYKTYGVTGGGLEDYVVRSSSADAFALVKNEFKKAKKLSAARFKVLK